MNKRNLFYLLLSMLLSMAVSCTDHIGSRIDEHFFLENQGAVMPVFVRGNIEAKTLLVYLHGGPGGSSLEAFQHAESPLTRLQSDYAVVYWEQRCAGSAQGSCGQLTLAQYTQDLDKLLVLLRHKYGTDARIFLLGHSWGGSLGINYLSTTQRQQQVSGWIEIAGGHSVPRIVRMEQEMLLEIGNEQIAQQSQADEWQALMEQARALDLNQVDDIYKMNRLASQAEGLVKKSGLVNPKISNTWASDYFLGPMDMGSANHHEEVSFEGMKQELAALDLSDRLPDINIPTLLLWGKYDFRVPPAFAQEEIQRYGSTQKKLIILEKSAHFVHWNEPDACYQHIRQFMEQTR